ncbi:hypothetical protein OG698_26685 [Streptomyces sp. NBC_01003]|uniref:hypothetical protein n=1 Tax=Streptomyces sp. NBC_01003 TaxID=2903714 RepID=UPI003865D38B|nr:hypothetical protein OG698_26685 [Streptomyces sp. NBC_01003]
MTPTPRRAGEWARRLASAALKGVRVLWRYVWAPPARATKPAAAPPRNRAYLHDRLVALPLLAAIAFSGLGFTATSLRDDSAAIRTHIAPALRDLADARISLRIAQREAEVSLGAGDAVELSGLSPRYGSRITGAAQDLSQVSRSGALTAAERQELDVVSGLVDGYERWIAWAQTNVSDGSLYRAGLSYAQSMLCSPDRLDPYEPATGRYAPYPRCAPVTGSEATTVVDRISDLERALRHRLEERATLGPAAVTAAAVSAVAFVLLTAGLWRTLRFLRIRFRILASPPLLAAALPLLAVPVIALSGLYAYAAQEDTVPIARRLYAVTSPSTEVAFEEHRTDPLDPHHHRVIVTLADSMDDVLDNRRLAALDAVAPWAAPAGLLVAGVIGATLHAYRREYLLVRRPGTAV